MYLNLFEMQQEKKAGNSLPNEKVSVFPQVKDMYGYNKTSEILNDLIYDYSVRVITDPEYQGRALATEHTYLFLLKMLRDGFKELAND